MRYYLKKYTPVFRAGEKICIGYPRKKKYIELENTNLMYNQLKKVICDGIKKEDLNHWLFRKMLDFDFLEELSTYKEVSDCDRDSLYFDYLGYTKFNDKIKIYRYEKNQYIFIRNISYVWV